MRRAFVVLPVLCLAAVGSSQKLATRWAKTKPWNGFLLRMAANPLGGVALLESDKTTSFFPNGDPRWTVIDPYLDNAAFDRDGHLYTVGIEEEAISSPTHKWLHFNRFGPDGTRLLSRRIDKGAPESTRSEIKVDDLQRPWVMSRTVFDSESNPNPSSRLDAYDSSLQLRFGDGASGYSGIKLGLDPADNAYMTIGSTFRKVGPTGQVLWSYSGSNLSFIRMENGLLFVSGYAGSPYSRILDGAGANVGEWGPADAGPKYDEHSFLATTQRPQAPNSVQKISDTGALLWKRALGDGSWNVSTVSVIGRDKWGYIYALVSDVTPEIIKLSPSGAILWRRRTVAEEALVSPFNGDIFYRDFLNTGFQHMYCLHQAPVGKPDFVSAPSGTRIVHDVSQNDEYGVDATYTITTPPSVGTATITPEGILRYSAKSGFSGVVNLRYEARKNGLTPASDVLITISVQ